MSGSPVYIDGRLVGAVSYSLGQFSKEAIAGITPIDEMIEDTALAAPLQLPATRVALQMPLTQDNMRELAETGVLLDAALRREPEPTCRCSAPAVDASIGAMLRPIATPLTIGGFDASVIDPLAAGVPGAGLPADVGRALRSGPTLRRVDGLAAEAGRFDRRRSGHRRSRSSAPPARSPRSTATASTPSAIRSTASGPRSSR